jgi:hypothetical protein
VDAIEIINNTGAFAWLFDAHAALRNAAELRKALEAGRTHAHRQWSWTITETFRNAALKSRSAVRFSALRLRARQASLPLRLSG